MSEINPWCIIKDCQICKADEQRALREAKRRVQEAAMELEVEIEEAPSIALFRVRRKSDGLYYRTHIWNRHWDRCGTFLTREGLNAAPRYLKQKTHLYEVERYGAFRNDEWD